MAMKIVIAWDLCESNFVCNDVCPELFTVNEEEDSLEVSEAPISDELLDDAEKAAVRCPKGAIALVEAGL